jgi:transposase-like protein
MPRESAPGAALSAFQNQTVNRNESMSYRPRRFLALSNDLGTRGRSRQTRASFGVVSIWTESDCVDIKLAQGSGRRWFMKSNRKPVGGAGRRERRQFRPEFKAEAVQRVAERRAHGVPMAQIGRALDVLPAQLRVWAQEVTRRTDCGGAPVGETRVQELRRFHRESAVCCTDTIESTLNRVWVADITHIPTREGWLYLAALRDLASRRCVGWALRYTLDRELAARALLIVREARRPVHDEQDLTRTPRAA